MLIILMTYCFGNGVFWPTTLFLALHSIFIAVSYHNWKFGNDFEMRRFFHCCMIGLANIYCQTWIPYTGYSSDKALKDVLSKSRMIHREICTTVLFIIENMIILIIMIYSTLINSSSIIYHNMILLHLTMGAIFLHCLGVFLRFFYLNGYHVWRDLIWTDFWSKETWPSFFRKECLYKNY